MLPGMRKYGYSKDICNAFYISLSNSVGGAASWIRIFTKATSKKAERSDI